MIPHVCSHVHVASVFANASSCMYACVCVFVGGKGKGQGGYWWVFLKVMKLSIIKDLVILTQSSTSA